jgi:hypothetical protein
MGNRRAGLTKCGISALAGIAVLGWIREPEKHQPARSPVSANSLRSTEARKTFYPPPTPTGEAATTKVPERDLGSIYPARQNHSLPNSAPTAVRVENPIKVHQRTSAVVKTPEPPQGNTGRHEVPQIVNDDAVTRSPERRTEGSQNRQESERPQDAHTPMPRADQHDHNQTPTQSPAIAKKERSNVRSVAIVLGTAAAGAAIGAVTRGGKGAAIGALSGGTGGLVYDRMTRRNNIIGVPGVIDNNSNSQSNDQQGNYQRYDRASSLARRFGTPNFN